MIEVLLALTVIAIGMTSVLGLFPVGLNASRNAVAQNCSADVADQLITYLRVTNEITPSQYAEAFTNTSTPLAFASSTNATVDISAGKLPDVSGSSNENNVDENSVNFLAAYTSQKILSDNKLEAGTIDFIRVAPGWSIFKVDNINNKPRTFFIIQGHNSNQNDASSGSKISRTIDYSAMALVWKSPVQIWRDNPDGTTGWEKWPSDSDIYSNAPTNTIINEATAFNYSGKLNIELSWPLELPYRERKKRYYQIVINKPAP